MEWNWNDGIGSRSRRPACLVVTRTGEIHRFQGEDIPGVVKVLNTKYQKNGKWSNTTFNCFSPDGTSVVKWSQSWEEGLFWPQGSWEDAFAWLKEQAKAVDFDSFKGFMVATWPKVAAKFEENAAAMMSMAADGPETVIVTRHSGLIEWLAMRGIIGEVISQASPADVDGRIVVGALPLHLAALAVEVVAIDLPKLRPDQRGMDLTPSEMDGAGASLTRYRVSRI